MAIEVTDELVAQVARLARLRLDSGEAAEMREHFRKVLEFVDELDGLELEGIEPSLFAVETSNVYREDDVWPSLPHDLSLRNAPERDGTAFVVPRIVADAGEGGA